MKIILCYPPNRNYQGYGQDTRWLPLGIASIGAYLKQQNQKLDVLCLDLFKFSIQESFEIIKANLDISDKNIVGFTCLTEQRISVFELCEQLKEFEYLHTFTKIYTVIGGAHAGIMSNQIKDNYPYVDHIIKGEGEKAFYDIADKINNDIDVDRIVEFEPVKNLQEFPHAIDGFSLFKTELQVDEAPIIFSRGCTDLCTFCSTTKFWKGYRSRPASDVFNEMLKFYTIYNCKYFKFQDDACTADIENLKHLCKLIIDFEYDKIWQFEITARADQFDEQLISMLKLAGCKKLAIGIESGNEEQRKKMNKKLNIEKAKENIKLLKQAGIEVGILLIVGYPGENDSTIQDTVNFIRETKPNLTYKQPLMVFPGTIVYNQLKKENWIDDKYWLEDQPQPYYTKEADWNTLNKWTNQINKASRNIRVLIVVPARQTEQKFKLHIEGLNNLIIPEYVNIDRLFILHNSKNLEKYLSQKDVKQVIETKESYNTDENTHHWKNENLQMITNIKNSVISNKVILNNYDFIFWVDSDLILKPLTLKQLIDSNKDIVSEIFWTEWVKGSNKIDPNAWDLDHYSFFENTIENYKKPGLYKCGGTGACILVSTDVYKSGVNYSPISNVSFWGEDRAFCIRAVVAGFTIWVDTNYSCFHLYRDEDVKEYEEYIKAKEKEILEV
jgi:radical SAM superfamily enzyme YgiQ (UPF0313 family)